MPNDNWKILVEGFGQHHEGSTLDADHLAKDLVRALALNGHSVSKATFGPGAHTSTPTDLGVVQGPPTLVAGEVPDEGEIALTEAFKKVVGRTRK